MNCPSCHAENDDLLTSCAACGQALGTSASPTLTVGTVVASRYEIQATLGKGGMGMVFKAKDKVLDEIVALKILRPDVAGSGEMAQRFRREIKLARKVRHRNVCGIYEYDEEHGLAYIAMELIEGIDLKRLLRERGGLPPAEAFDVAIQIARGLEAIHEIGIIHRDLKTANAMLDKHGVVRLMDFGIAKKYDTEGSVGATAVGHIIGTPEYMSPEQARGEKIDFRSDIYALGVMIFELFAGKVPFQAETPIATIFKHLQDPPPLDGPAAASIPASVIPVLARCLAKDPEVRYPTAGALVEALQAARAACLPEASASPLPATTRLGAYAGETRVTGRVAPPHTPTPGSTPAPRTPTGRATPPPVPSVLSPTGMGRASTAGDAPTVFSPVRTGQTGRSTAPRMTVAPVIPAPAPERRNVMTLVLLGGIGFVAVAALAGIGALWLLPGPKPTAEATATPLVTATPTPLPTSDLTISQPTPEPTSTARPTPRPPNSPTPTPFPTPTPPPTPSPTPTAVPLALHARTPTPTPTPPPPLVEERAMGVLQITAKPWADVAIDGESKGRTPIRVKVKAGKHRIVFSHPEFQPLPRVVNVQTGQDLPVDIDLTWEGVRK